MRDHPRVLLGNVYNALMMDGRVEAHAAPLLNGSPRKLWLAEDGDVVAANRPFDPAFVDHVARTTGLAADRVTRRVLSDGWARPSAGFVDDLARHAAVIAPYALEAPVIALAARIGASIEGYAGHPAPAVMAAVDRLNTKTGFRDLAAELALPIPEGIACRGREALDAAVASLLSRHDRVIVKMDRSSNGYGNLVLERDRGVPPSAAVAAHCDRLAGLPERWVVEECLDFVSLPSAEFTATDEGSVLSYVCDQRSGPRSGMATPHPDLPLPARDRLIAVGETVGRHLVHLGYRGVFDVDGGFTRDGRIVVTESNVRRTAGTHIEEIARRLLGDDRRNRVWLSGALAMSRPRSFAEILADLREAGLAFDPVRRRGVLPTVDDAAGRRHIYAVFAADHAEARDLEDRLATLVQA